MAEGSSSASPPPASPTAPSSSSSSSSSSSRISVFKPPTPDDIRAQEVFNNCAVRTVMNGAVGVGMGFFMGMFLGALDNPLQTETMTARQQLVHTARTMGSKSVGMAKTFAIMGAVFSASECVIEKARARHDITNTAVAGCVTGGAVSHKAGVKAACLGCAGFAAFSVVFEKLLDSHT